MIRTYKLQHHINKNKQLKIMELLKNYRKLSTTISNIQWRLFFQTSTFNKMDNSIKNIDTKLSQRYRQTAQYQVVSQLKSYISNRENDFRRLVTRSSLSEEVKHQLFTINKYCGYYRKDFTFKKVLLSDDILRLSRYIMRHLFKKNRKPSFRRCNMALDNKVAIISENNGNSSYDYWVNLSTTEKGKTVFLPIKSNSYYETARGARKNFCQINQKNNALSVCFMKEQEPLKYQPTSDKVAIDIGLRTLFATDDGDLLGRDLIDNLRHYDTQLSKIVKSRQKEGLSVKTFRYNRIVNKVKGLLKQEICRSINRVINIHSPKELVIENLDFSNTDLSRQMNRILRNCGMSVVKQKMNQIEQELGIVVTYVNPAYSSQVCIRCGYVDEKNRPSQKVFKCRLCGLRLHADVKSAKEHLLRSSYVGKKDNPYGPHKSKQSVLKYIVKNMFERLKDQNSVVLDLSLLAENKYYSGYDLGDKKISDNGRSEGFRRKKKKKTG